MSTSLFDVGDRDRSVIPGYLEFAVSVHAEESATVVEVTGELDCHTSPQLRDQLLGLADDGVQRVIVDLGGNVFIDSTGLGVFVRALKRFRDEGAEMVLRSPTPATIRLLDVTGMTRLFEII